MRRAGSHEDAHARRSELHAPRSRTRGAPAVARPIGPRERAIGLAMLGALLVAAAVCALPAQRGDICLAPGGASDLCYCEAFGASAVKQPVNALSSLAFAIYGVMMLFARPLAKAHRRPSLLARDGRLQLAFAVTSMALGAASLSFHASFLLAPGLFDTLGIIFWLTLATSLHLGRAGGWSGSKVLAVFGVAATASFVVAAGSLAVFPGANGPHWVSYAVSAGTAVAPFVAYARRGFPGWASEKWLVAALATFFGGFFVYVRSETGAPWCTPSSWLQGHALWHVTCATAVFLSFEHARRTAG
jgi:hypothetical protein